MGEGGFPEREGSELGFEEEGESRARVCGIRRVEGVVSGDDEWGVVGRAELARAGFESESEGWDGGGGGGGVGEFERGERGEVGGEREGDVGGVGGGGGEVGEEWEVEDCNWDFSAEEERRRRRRWLVVAVVVVILVVVLKFE